MNKKIDIKLKIYNNKNNCKDYQNRFFKNNNNNKHLKMIRNINLNNKVNFNNNKEAVITIFLDKQLMIIHMMTSNSINKKTMGITMTD